MAGVDEPQSKAALTSHKKSRSGCKACKTRKVKCNEERPSCASCVRRKLPCEYLIQSYDHRQRTITRSPAISQKENLAPASSASASHALTRDLDKVASLETEERRLLELRLLHHFVTTTACNGFISSHDADVVDLWQIHAPKLAFEHKFLLNAIIAVAALHLTKIDPDRWEMAEIYRNYFNAAVSEYRKALVELSPLNAEAISVTAVLIQLPAFTLLQNSDNLNYAPPLQLFRLVAGNTPLYQQIKEIVPEKNKFIVLAKAKPSMFGIMEEVDKETYRKRFSQFLNWRAPGEVVDEESQRAYEFVLSMVAYILTTIERGDDILETRRLVYSFASLAPQVYVKRLEERNPRALVALAYFFCLVKAVDNVWWMRGIAEREVFGIQSILAEQWQWALQWPLSKLSYFAASATHST